jgi:hypothetical protein
MEHKIDVYTGKLPTKVTTGDNPFKGIRIRKNDLKKIKLNGHFPRMYN